MKKHKSFASRERKRDIFLRQGWIWLVLFVNIILLFLALVDRKPFDFGSYAVTAAFVDTAMFYFILLKIKDDIAREQEL